MKNLLENLKRGGKRSNAEAEFQFMLYFYNLIDNKYYNLKLSNQELILFDNYIDSIPLDLIKKDLIDLFTNGEICNFIFDKNKNFDNLSILSDFKSFGETYPNISNKFFIFFLLFNY